MNMPDTHDVENVSIQEIRQIEIVTTQYSQYSDARGTLLIFVFIRYGVLDFSRSALVALDSAYTNNVVPFRLFPGQHKVFVYDIESNGTLFNGVGYPAVIYEFQTRGNNLGKLTSL